MKTYIVQPTDGTASYEVQADSVEHESITGATCFYTGEGDSRVLVARLLNVSFHEKPAAE